MEWWGAAPDHPEHEQKQSYPDVLQACAAWLEPIEEQLQQNIFFKKQQTQKINEQTERSYVLEVWNTLTFPFSLPSLSLPSVFA
jgi:hypothetical protein